MEITEKQLIEEFSHFNKEHLLILANSGLSLRKMAKECGVDLRTVRKYIDRFKIDYAVSKKANKGAIPKEVLEAKINEYKDLRQISKELGRSEHNVSYWVDKYKLSTKKASHTKSTYWRWLKEGYTIGEMVKQGGYTDAKVLIDNLVKHKIIDGKYAHLFSVTEYNIDSNKWNDLVLVERFIGGDQNAANLLYKRYYNMLLYYAKSRIFNQEDAEDIVAITFTKAFNKIDKYRPEGAFSTWVYKILMNNTIDFLRKRKLKTISIDEPYRTEKGDEVNYDFDSGYENPEETLIKEQKHEKVRESVKNLPQIYKEVIEAVYFEGLRYDEAAEELHLPIGTVKARLHRAKFLLNQQLSKAILNGIN